MTLENLLRIGQLKAHAADASEIERLLSAAQRNLTDARSTTISPETRFDAAYRAILETDTGRRETPNLRPLPKPEGRTE